MAQTVPKTAKIAATPTQNAWSQSYSAGSLFVALSLTQEEPLETLGTVGKAILHALEAEYFSLEQKSLQSVKDAVVAALRDVPTSVSISLAVASLVDTILYIYTNGGAEVILRRDGKIGTILDSREGSLTSSSGFTKPGDLIFLATKAFCDIVPLSELLPHGKEQTAEELAETITPLVHRTQQGDAASIIIELHEVIADESGELVESGDQAAMIEQKTESGRKTSKIPRLQIPFSLPQIHLKKKQSLFLLIACLFGVLLFVSIMLTIKSQQNSKNQALYNEVYSQAKKKYDEGQGLIILNKSLASEDFQSAISLIDQKKSLFPTNSPELVKLMELRKQIELAMGGNSGTSLITPTVAAEGKSPMLSLALTHTNTTSIAQDDKAVYLLGNNTVTSVDKGSKTEKQIIKSLTSDQKAIGAYLGNVYVLDTKINQIIKYTSVEAGYTKSNYLSADISPQFSNAVCLTVDGSVYVLTTTGEIIKYTRGKPDTFSINNLNKPLSHPTRITTSSDMDHLYVLDPGNSRIVVLSKEGTYTTDYTAKQFKNATEIDVSEKEKKLYFLEGGKVWEIPLQ